MKIIVTKDTVKIEEFDLVHEGEHKVNKCSFSFSAEYTKELVKKAIFTSQNSSVEVAIINNECDIPTEILRARNIVLLGVYAYKVTEDKLDLRYSPSPDAFNVNNGSYIEGASDSEEITPSQFEQYMQAMNDGLNKVEKSLTKMDEATSSANDLVEDISQKLENGDFIGPEGPQGVQGTPGKDGINGADGVGITTITSGQSTVEEDKTITPVTVQKTDGSSQIFKVEAKNGQDGKDGVNGQDGLTPLIGENGNWFLGDTDTGKPSRGEAGPSPDLSNYVKNTDYASDGKGGVVSTGNHFRVYSNNGVPYVNSINLEQYSSSGDNIFISKGTLEKIKDDYVGSSTPVQDLTATVTNVQNDQDENKPKQTASGEMITVDDALAYKTFYVTVDGASEQITTNGNQLIDFNNPHGKSTGVTSSFENNLLTVDGAAGAQYQSVFYNITDIVKANAGKTLKYKNKNNSVTNENAISVAQIIVYYTDETPTTYKVIYNYKTSASDIYTIPSDISNIQRVVFGIYTNNSANTDIENTITIEEPLLYLDDNDVYEPYTGGQPSPSPDYPQEITTLTFDKITICGKNIFDYDKFLNDIGDSLTIEGTNNNFTYRSNNSIASTLGIFKFNFKEKTSYSFSGKISSSSANGAMKVIYTDGTSFYIYSKWDGTSLSEEFFKTTDKTKTIKQIEISSYGNGTVFELTDFMISEGSTATEYEPYQGQSYDVDLQGNEMVELPNGVKDELVIDKQGNISLIKNIGKIVFDGSEDEDWSISEPNEYGLINCSLPQLQIPNQYSYPFISNHFIKQTTLFAETQTQGMLINATIIYLRISNSIVSSLQELKTWLQSHNITVYYQLANSQTIPLGTLSELITTLNGTNNISINGNIPTTISTTYALDIKKYIDNKLAEISTQIIKEG